MIRAMHYFVVAFLILGFVHGLTIFYNIAAGIMIGFGVASWVVSRQEAKDFDDKIKKADELIDKYLKTRQYDSKIPDEPRDN